MTRHAYPSSAMLGDYLRAAAGLFPTLGILAAASPGIAAITILTGLAALFAAFGFRTALRHGTEIEVTDETLTASGLFHVSIPWRELDRMKLAYYSTRRDRRAGWMQLDLRSGGSALRIDDRIEGFAELARVAARAAEMHGLSLDAATLVNLRAIGIDCTAVTPAIGELAGGRG